MKLFIITCLVALSGFALAQSSAPDTSTPPSSQDSMNQPVDSNATMSTSQQEKDIKKKQKEEEREHLEKGASDVSAPGTSTTPSGTPDSTTSP